MAKKKTAVKKKKTTSKSPVKKSLQKVENVKKTISNVAESVVEQSQTIATKAKEALEVELSTRKARLVEKYIRQGKAWPDIEKNLIDFAQKYSMKANFESRSVIAHPKLGIGYVMAASNNRMTVYFQEGIKNLIMNYKA